MKWGFILACFIGTFCVSGCKVESPEVIEKREQAAAEEKAAAEADRRFEVISKQKVEGRRIWVLKDKETDHEYVLVTYGKSVVFRPLLKKEKR